MRAREFVPKSARWLTVDPLWPEEPAYTYASNNPISKSDPSGLGSCTQGPPTLPNPLHPGKCDMPYDQWACNKFCKARGYGTGIVTYTGNNGVTTGTDGYSYTGGDGPANSCNCTCSGGNPPGCTPAQVGFCMRACKAIGRSYVGCVPITLGRNDAQNCRCSEK